MSALAETEKTVAALEKYKYGFVTDIEMETLAKGLNEDVVRFISAKKDEPEWMLEWRLAAFRRWREMEEPTWARVHYPKIDYQNASYYAAPKQTVKPASLDEVDPKLLETYKKLGIPLHEQMLLAGVAVDAVFDSVSVATTFKAKLGEAGVIFCPISEAIREHPELVRKYLGSVVPVSDNFFATLNSAVFSDGSFVYVPKGVRCPMELSTYFRINAQETGQFERTLIIADEGAYVSYLEGCTAPKRDENQLHAAVVELVALDDAEIKYSTVQNWYPGDEEGKGGIYNFVTKRGDCRGANSKISWTQVETGSAITWKYPSCILRGDNSVGEFYSIAITNHYQQADTGTKMIHLGKNTRSRIISKGISAGHAQNTYRGLVERASEGGERAQFHAVRFAADRPAMRRAHRALYRKPQSVGAHRARSDDVEDRRRPAVLLHLARHSDRGSRGADRQRLLQGSAAAIADGIRGRGAEAGGNFAGRERGIKRMLEIKNLHVAVGGKEILKGLTLSLKPGEVHAIMGPNGSGKSTLSYTLAGRAGYDITEGSIRYKGEDLAAMPTEERAAKGIFLALQYPVEIPGVTTMMFLKTALNAQRRARGEPSSMRCMCLRLVREKAKALNVSEEMLKRALNVGFSGGEKKRLEILQMALFEP